VSYAGEWRINLGLPVLIDPANVLATNRVLYQMQTPNGSRNRRQSGVFFYAIMASTSCWASFEFAPHLEGGHMIESVVPTLVSATSSGISFTFSATARIGVPSLS